MKVAEVVQSLEGPDESDDLQVKWHSDKSVGESGSIGSLIPPSLPAHNPPHGRPKFPLFVPLSKLACPNSDATDISTDITAIHRGPACSFPLISSRPPNAFYILIHLDIYFTSFIPLNLWPTF